MTRMICVTGGVVSSLGKGIAAATLGSWFKQTGRRVTFMKLDPYINVDPGTMSPFQHGEVFVTEDGTQADLDLGHYERFANVKMARCNSVTTGQIYHHVMAKERQGGYAGKTVQVVPHITDHIQERIVEGTSGYDIAIIEIGGTVGDIESLPFLEAIRQLRVRFGAQQVVFVHLTLLPYLDKVGEMKTKPTQHSVKELRSIGIQPDVLLCRAAREIEQSQCEKIALYTNVAAGHVFSLPDVDHVYHLPQMLNRKGVGQALEALMGLEARQVDLRAWQRICDMEAQQKATVKIAVVGKYTDLSDAYKSLFEALHHAGLHLGVKLDIVYVQAETLNADNVLAVLSEVAGVLIPGGFGERAVEGMVLAVQYARCHNVPYFGICLGMQMAVVEFARHVLELTEANSSEFAANTQHPVVHLISKQQSHELHTDMRLGLSGVHMQSGSRLAAIYQREWVSERHRHRYEINEAYVDALHTSGLQVVARSDEKRVEAVEIKGHPWFVAVQYHPEFSSSPWQAHPLFMAFAKAAVAYQASECTDVA